MNLDVLYNVCIDMIYKRAKEPFFFFLLSLGGIIALGVRSVYGVGIFFSSMYHFSASISCFMMFYICMVIIGMRVEYIKH